MANENNATHPLRCGIISGVKLPVTHFKRTYTQDKHPQLNPVPQTLTKLTEFERSLNGIDQPFLASKANVLNNINRPEGLQRFIESKPELTLGIRHMSILTGLCLAIPKYGIINLHSRLPWCDGHLLGHEKQRNPYWYNLAHH